ncbi:hypothetical protein C8A05DRAFT_34939 [Staphylotrichum tortipilum]|uniref:MACPF-like domain-containing protein n=1 Tax=Staphylotrichum tortipilum TaxID=2831512 RepID=A0AAN6RS39_9PEZI|nr:hypothetical protein C8A05DRAFT_34939 [Staphylotrichum longicolle]
MAPPSFHVAIDSPAGTSFPSFPSSAMEGGDVTKITLDMVRNKCSISNKFFFTVDGKSRVADTTTLGYYMSLTAEGQKLLQPPASTTSTSTTSSSDPPAAAPGVQTFVIKVADSTVKQELVDLPGKNEALTKLLDSISSNPLTKGTLPTFADKTLTSLVTNYASAVVTGRVYSYAEPSELTEVQWDSVLKNNRALHGYGYDFKLSAFVTAPKPAFRLRGAAPVGKPPSSSTTSAPAQQYLPPIPPFYVHDRATVKVIEVRSQQQNTWIKEGFNSMAVGGSLGGGPASVPVSVQASWEKEHSYANQKREVSDIQSLAVTYNFPRAVLELDPDTLELTDQCRADALKVTSTAARDKFFRDYGTIFATRVTLGGFLYSTRSVKSTELATLDQVKDTTRIAAGISAQTPKASGSLNIAKVDSTSTETGQANLLQQVCLTWDAQGGDTLLCTNPPAWANTVKDHRLWRLMNKERLVSVEYLIKDLDTEPWHRLTNPTSTTNVGKNLLTDQAFQDYLRALLMDAALDEGAENIVMRKMGDYYAIDTTARVAAYNSWLGANFPQEKDVSGIMTAGVAFKGLGLDQIVGWGLWMTSKGELTWA